MKLPAFLILAKGGPVKKLCEYLKVAEAAEFIGVSQTTLRKWADQGQIPMYVNKANGYRLFLQKDLERFLGDMARPVKQSQGTTQRYSHRPKSSAR